MGPASQKIEWHKKLFSADDLEGALLVIAATSLRDVNAAVYQEAERRGILCNAVDDIDNCHFYYGCDRSAGGSANCDFDEWKKPGLGPPTRKEFEHQFGPEYAAWLEWLGAAREVLSDNSKTPGIHQTLAPFDRQPPDV